MAEYATIALADITVPPRLREVDEDQASILASQIKWQGLLNPITVRRTPPATKPFRKYTLIAGAHRRRGVELNGDTTIGAMIVEADAIDGMMLEVSENLIRNELTALERAIFVLSYREAWEKKFGTIQRGGDRTKEQRDKLSLCSDNPLNIVEAAGTESFYENAAARLGIHPKGIKRATRIARSVHPFIRERLRGTAHADNQNFLLKIAGLGPDRQAEMVRALAAETVISVEAAIEVTDPAAQAKAQRDGQAALLDRLLGTWSRASETTKAEFLALVAAGERKKAQEERLPGVRELLEAGGINLDAETLQ